MKPTTTQNQKVAQTPRASGGSQVRRKDPRKDRRKDRKDAFRILFALVFIVIAALASVDRDSLSGSGDAQIRAESRGETNNSQSRSWASLLLEALQRIV